MIRFNLFLLSLFCLVKPSLSQVDLQSGLVACYSFSGNAKDGSGHNYDGTVNGASLTTDRYGRVDSAYRFDGINDFISIPSAPIVVNRNFTISTWTSILVNPGYGESNTVISIGPANSYHYGQTLTNHYASTELTGWTMGGYNQAGSTSMTTNSLPAANTWYHLVMTRDDVSVKMYINGVVAGSGLNGGSPPYYYQTSSSVTYIGLRSNSTQPFNGAIDDVSIYDRALSPEEVQELYAMGLPCTPVNPPPTPQVESAFLCGHGQATLTASGGKAYRWYDSQTGGNLVFEGNPLVTPDLSATANYFVANVAGTSESPRTKVTVTILPSPNLVCNFPGITKMKIPQVFSVSITSGVGPFSYQFNFGDGNKLETSQSSPIYTFAKEDKYHIQVNVTDSNGCQSACSSDIEVWGEVFIPNVITVNKEDTVNTTFTVYFKTGGGYSKYFGHQPFHMRIYNRWGKLVFTTDDSVLGWEGEGEETGVYFYSLQLGDEEYKGWLDVIR